MKKTNLMALILVVLMIVAIPAALATGPSQPPIVTDTLYVGHGGWGPRYADPVAASDKYSQELIFNAYDRLIMMGEPVHNPVPPEGDWDVYEQYWAFSPLLATNVPDRVEVMQNFVNATNINMTNPTCAWLNATPPEPSKKYHICNWCDNNMTKPNNNSTLGPCDVVYIMEYDATTDEIITCRTWHVVRVGIVGSVVTLYLHRFYYDFYIRTDPVIYFVDETGDPVDTFDINDVEYSFERGLVQDPDLMYKFYKPLFDKMSSDYWDTGNSTDAICLSYLIDDAFEINSTDPPVFRINVGIDFPDVAFKQIMCGTWASIVSREFSISIGCWDGDLFTLAVSGYPAWWEEVRHVHSPYDTNWRYAGTGPYFVPLVSQPYNLVILQRNPHYWRGWPAPGRADYLEYIDIEYLADWATRRDTFKACQLDVCAVPRAFMGELLDPDDPAKMTPIPNTIKTIKNIYPVLSLDAVMFTFAVNPSSPCIGTGSLENGDGIPVNFFNNTNVRRAFACAMPSGRFVYNERDTVSVGDKRLTAVNVTTVRYSNNSIVTSTDADRGWSLSAFNTKEKFVNTSDTDMQYDSGELIYRDNDNSGSVTIGDTRLTNVTLTVTGEDVGTGDGVTKAFQLDHYPLMPNSEKIYNSTYTYIRNTDYTIDYTAGQVNFVTAPEAGVQITADYYYYFSGDYPPGSTVQTGDSDIGLVLRNFGTNEMFVDMDASSTYSSGEFIYRDVGRNMVSDGDIRATDADGYEAGSVVSPYAFDVNRTLTNGVLYYNQIIEQAWANEASEPATPLLEGLIPDYRDPNVHRFNLANYSYAKVKTNLRNAIMNATGGSVGTTASVWTWGFTLTITYPTGNDQAKITCNMIRDFFTNMSSDANRAGCPPFDISVMEVDWPTYLSNFESGMWPICIMPWQANYADADDFERPFMHSEGYLANNQKYTGENGWCNTSGTNYPTLNKDQLIDLAVKTPDGPERAKMYADLQNIYIKDIPSIPVVQPFERKWVKYWVRGWYYNALYPSDYYYHLYKMDTCWADVTGREETGWPDGVCNMRDIGYVAARFGASAPTPTQPYDPRWAPGTYGCGGADVYGDRKIDMRDIGFACAHFLHEDEP